MTKKEVIKNLRIINKIANETANNYNRRDFILEGGINTIIGITKNLIKHN